MQKTTQPDHSHDRKDPASPQLRAGSLTQMHATTAAKDAHIKEAGLGGNRTGEVSEAVKRTQAARDAANDISPETSKPSPTLPKAEYAEEHSDARAIQVQVNTDHNIHGSQNLNCDIENTVNASLGRFGSQLTRVEIHLSDDNGNKSHGDDKHCLLEARPAGHQPLVVTAVAATIDDAVSDAVEKMERLLDSTLAKLHDPKGRTSLGQDLTV